MAALERHGRERGLAGCSNTYILKMGLDGGTFASRADILRRASWNMATADSSWSTRGGAIPRGALIKTVESASHANLMAIRWSTCALTGEDLPSAKGIVACALGNLYSRQAVLEHLLGTLKGTAQQASTQEGQRQVKEAFGHLTSLSSVFDVTLTPDPTAAPATAPSQAAAMAGAASGRSVAECAAPRFACPIVHCVTDGRNNFVAVRPCGCVVSARAMKQIHGSSGSGEGDACPVCNGVSTSLVPLNGTAEQVGKLKQALQAATAEAKQKKKDAKREKKKKRKLEGGYKSGGGAAGDGGAALMLPPPPKRPKLPGEAAAH